MSTTVLNTLKKLSMLGLFAIASGMGCAAEQDASTDDGFVNEQGYLDIEDGEGKADGDDINQVMAKYRSTSTSAAYKFFNLRADRNFDMVLASSANRGLGTILHGTYTVADDLLNDDRSNAHYFMVQLRFTSADGDQTMVGQSRNFEVTIPNDWGTESSVTIQRIQFSGRADANTGKPGVASRGPMVKLNYCDYCSLKDYDDKYIHDDDRFRLTVNTLAVKPYKAGECGAAFPTRWDDYNDGRAAPDLKVCTTGGVCSSTLNDVGKDSNTCGDLVVGTGMFGTIGTFTGEDLRVGMDYIVYDSDGLTSDTVGKRHATMGNDLLDGGRIAVLGSFGRVNSLRLNLEQVP